MVSQAAERGALRGSPGELTATVQRRWAERLAGFWRDSARSKGAVLGAVLLAALIVVTLTAHWLEPYNPIGVQPTVARQKPSADHLFGTDQYGRDVLSRVIDGAHLSLEMGLAAVVISVVGGTVMGLIAGYNERLLDSLIMRFVDMLLAFPGILLALAIVAALGASLTNVILAVGVGTIPVYARVVRGTVLSTKREPYIEAARVCGCSDARVILRHILPNITAPVLVLATIGVAYSILNGSALSFLGLGVQPPGAEWGLMVSDGRSYLRDAWWMTTAPGLALAVTVLAMNLVGDGLRDAFDPRSRRR
jgi:peptide/nickel transport system permease protein